MAKKQQKQQMHLIYDLAKASSMKISYMSSTVIKRKTQSVMIETEREIVIIGDRERERSNKLNAPKNMQKNIHSNLQTECVLH